MFYIILEKPGFNGKLDLIFLLPANVAKSTPQKWSIIGPLFWDYMDELLRLPFPPSHVGKNYLKISK